MQRLFVVFWGLVALVTGFSIVLLERERASVVHRSVFTEAGPATVYSNAASADGPLVVVAHGFVGSRQMMQYISRDLARSGFIVVAFDFVGHGRNDGLLSKDVTRIEGTTRQLVEQSRNLIASFLESQGRTDVTYGLLGHSMATDILIRTAQDDPRASSIVAISMYSDVVTPQFPKHLLIVSGEWEERLRIVGRRLIAQIDPSAKEGQTVVSGDVARRAVSIPKTEHVAVLFDSRTMYEANAWFRTGLGVDTEMGVSTWRPGGPIVLALIGIAGIFVRLCRFLPQRVDVGHALPLSDFCRALLFPVIFSSAAVLIAPGDLFGMAAFGELVAFFAVWGATQLAVLRHQWSGPRLSDIWPIVFFLGFGGAAFAFALDRYAASFVPSGPRWSLMAVFLVGTVPFAVGDRLLVFGGSVWRRTIARLTPLVCLSALMVAGQSDLALLFAAVPVLGLYYLVFGSMAHAVAARTGPVPAGLALGITLAWSIAASMPLFAA